MKVLRHVCAGLLFISSIPALAALAPATYFPPGKLDDFTVKWYGGCLAAAAEPSLYQLSKENHQALIYRLTVFPPFSEAVIMRLKERPDGRGMLTLTRIDQAPGPWTRKAQILLTREGMRHFHDLMDQSKFWHLNTESKTETVITDGTEFVYEGVQSGRYHLVERVYPVKDATFFAPAFYLLKLANEPTEGF